MKISKIQIESRRSRVDDQRPHEVRGLPGLLGAFFLGALLLCASAIPANAASLTFSVGSTNGVTNSTVVVPVRASNFSNISSFQFSFHWNTNIASFLAVEQFGLNGLGASNDSFGTTLTSTGTLTVLWIDPNGATTTVPDGTMLFGVRLHLVGPAAATSSVSINDKPTAIVAGDENGAALPVTINSGTLNIDRTLIVTCATNKTVECGSAWNFDSPMPTDSCGGLPVTINILSTITNSMSCGYTATRTWEILDACSNRTTCIQSVMAVDTTPPIVSAAPNKTVECGSLWNFDEPTATDNCSGDFVQIFVSRTITNATAACGATATRSWEIFDPCGNMSACTQVVTVVDTTPPVMPSQQNKTVECGSPWTFDTPSATDNCVSTNLVPHVLSTLTNATGPCGYFVTRTWEVFDPCSNRTTCAQIVTVVDTTKPFVSCVQDKTVECGHPWTFDEPTATDNCAGDLSPRIFSTVTNLTGACGFTATRIWEFVDPCNNRATCEQTVTVIDTTPPTPMCASNKTVECGSVWNFDAPTATDNCAASSNLVIRVLSTTTNAPGCGYTATRTWEIFDTCSNRSTCVQTVSVIDTTPPVPTCAQNKTVEFGAAWDFDPPSGTDECSPNVRIQIISTVTNAGPCGPAFTATRTWELSDDCSNKVSCAQTVTVRDTTAPTITCAPDKTINCLGAWSFDTPTAIDTATGTIIAPVVLSTITNGSCGSGLTVKRTWQATDACGNSATCSQTVSGRAIVSVSGTVFIPTNASATVSDKRLAGVTVLGPQNVNSITGPDGAYSCVFDAANNVTITPFAPTGGAASDGVQALDISLVRRHILQSVLLDSPYKILAADVDGSGVVSALDLSFMRRLVLGTTNRFPIGLWRFVPASFTNLLGTANPPTNLTYEAVGSDLTDQDFVAIKLGDVNNSWTPPVSLSPVTKEKLTGDATEVNETKTAAKPFTSTSPSANTLVLAAASAHGLPGTEVAIPIMTTNFANVRTFQFSFHWNTNLASFIALEQMNASLSGLPGDFGVTMTNNGTVTVAWDEPLNGSIDLPNGATIFAVRLKCTGSPSNTASLVIDSSPTPIAVTDGSDLDIPFTVQSGLLGIDQPNRAPVITPVSDKTVDELTPLTFTVVASDPDGAPQTQTFSLDPSAPAGASIDAATGVFAWTPTEAQGPGTYPIAVRVADNGSPPLSNSVSFTIFVNEVNAAPAVSADNYSVNEDAVLTVGGPGVLENDSDSDGDPLIALVGVTTTHGTLSLSADGSFIYIPSANFHGTDSFTYRANDGHTNSVLATVTITVNSVNDTPVAADDAYTTAEDTALNASTANGVLANDIDVDGDALNVVLIANVSHGALTLNLDGSFNYLPATNFHGTDSFTYRANDGLTNSGIATVIITVTSVNDTPVAVNDNFYITLEDTQLDVPATSGVLTNDFDVDGDALTALMANTTTNGVLTLNTNGAFLYLPRTNFNGVDHFTYRVTDGQATSDVAVVTITVTPLNDAPLANADAYTTAEDSSLIISSPGVLSNDIDVDGDPLKALLVSNAAHGTLNFNTNGSFTYSPNLNYNGLDSFTYRATDGLLTSGVATVTITITPVNDAPVAANDSYLTAEDTTLTVSAASGVLANDTDVDGDALSAVLVSNVAHGTLNLSSNGGFTYTPNANFNGTDSFTYAASDGSLSSGTATVTITISSVNDAPVALNDSYATDEDTTLNVSAPGVLGNDSDVEGDVLHAVLVSNVSHGTLALGTDGSFRYTPAANFFGTDSFTYRANDGQANSGDVTVTIVVNPVNDAPVLAPIGDKIILDGDTLTFTASATDVDLPAQTLTFTLEGAPAGASINPSSGLFTWTPSEAQTPSTNSVTIRVTDNGTPALSAAETITLAVNRFIPPTISIADVTIAGGTDGELEGIFEVTLSEPVLRTVSVDFATANSFPASAIAGLDYLPAQGTLVFPPGTTNLSIDVTVIGNSTVYSNRSFLVNLGNATNGVIADAEGLGTITSDLAPGLYIDDVTVVEGNRGEKISAVFTVTLLGPNENLVTVSYATAPGTALARKDFKPKKGKLKFPPGTTTQTITVPITGDALNEDNETFVVNLSKSVNAVVVHGQGVGTILDNDPLPAISIGDVTTVEANTGARMISFLVRLSAKSGRAVSVDFATADGTALAGSDYVNTNGTLVFRPGLLKQKLTVAVLGNDVSENDETFSLNLGNPVNAELAVAQATANIIDRDHAPLAAVSDGVISDTGASALFTIQLSAPSERLITVNFATAHDTGLAGVDYLAVGDGAVDFQPGETSKTVSIDLLSNPAALESRTFFLDLLSATNAKIADRVGICIIPAAR